jgi:hypothetical protein
MYSDRLLGLERSGRALASADTRRFYHADLSGLKSGEPSWKADLVGITIPET